MFCVNCGIEIEEKYNFCPKCGTEKVNHGAEKKRNIVSNEKAMELGKKGFNLFQYAQYEEALDCCNRALKTDPNNESVLELNNRVVKILRGEE